jgi:selenocysteine-specific elongation factor
VHLGATDAQASVAVLDGDAIAPGGSGRIQLVMRHEVSAWTGDRVVLRDASASRTMAGGIVLDPFGPVRYRRTPQRLAELDALAALIRVDGQPASTSAPAALALLDSAPLGVDFARLAQAHGLLPGSDWGLPDAGLGAGPDAPLCAGDWRLGAAHHRTLASGVTQALATFHTAHPDELGPDTARLRRLTAPRLPEALWKALLAGLQARGEVAVRGAFVHLPEHGVRLSATEERIAQKVGPQLVQAGNDGAWVRDLARACNESEALLRITLARLAQRGELHQVVRDLFYPAATMERLAITARSVAAADGEVTAAAFRDATQLGRKRAIQILEYFDRIGLLRRVGDVHKLRADCALFREAQPA